MSSSSSLTLKALRFLAVALLCVFVAAPAAAWSQPRAAAAGGERDYQAGVSGEEAKVWFLAEGYTGGDFDTWILVQNPGEVDSEVTLRFQLPPGTSAADYVLVLPAGTRQSIHLDELPGLEATDVSTTVVATEPVVAERAVYFVYDGKPGGHDSVGVKYPSTIWYLAEGYTGGEFDTWVLVQNPGSADTSVTLDFQLPPGTSAESYTFDLPAGTRRSIHLDDLPGLEATDVSTKVSSPMPVVAERAMYFNYDSRVTGGSDSCGLPVPSTNWFLAEGYTGGEFDTWVLVQNPGSADTSVTLDFQLPPGTSADSYTFDLPAGTRRSIHLDDLPGLGSTDVSTTVVATEPVVAERAMYFNYEGKIDGHDSIGTRTPSCDWYLAEGYTGGEFDTWVLVQNPGEEDSTVTLHFQLPPGTSADSYTFDLPAGTRQSIHLDELPGLGATDVSTWVDSDGAVVAERAVYFNYEGKGGGHCSIGALYEPTLVYDTTRVLEDGDTQYLVSDEKPEEGKRVLTFSQTTPNLLSVNRGDVVVFGPCDLLPGGYIARVSELSVGSTVVMTLTAAGIEEAVARFHTSSAAIAAASSISNYQADPLFPVTLSQTFNVNTTIGSAPNYLDLSASLTVSLTIDFAINIDVTLPWRWVTKTVWGHSFSVLVPQAPGASLSSFSVGATITETIAIDATAHGDFDKTEMTFFTIPGTQTLLCGKDGIKIMAGPVPILLYPYFRVVAGAKGHIKAEVSMGVTQQGTVSAGYSYDGSDWTPSYNTDFSYSFRGPTDDSSFAQSDVTVAIGPQVGVKLYDICGPYINLMPGLRLTLDTDMGHPGNMLWAIYLTYDANVGILVELDIGELLGWGFKWSKTFLNKYYTFYHDEWLLVNKVVIYSLTPAEGGEGDQVTVDGWGFGGSRQHNSQVYFDDTPAPGDSYSKWTNNQIICKVPGGLNGLVDVMVKRIFHEWTIGPLTVRISYDSNTKPFLVNYAWQKVVGSGATEGARDIVQVADGYVVAGSKAQDGWLFKLDLRGNLVWEKTFGGTDYDYLHSLIQVSGGFVAAGWTNYTGVGDSDGWLVKTDVYGNLVWEKTFSGAYEDGFDCVRQAADGGYVLAGRKGLSEDDLNGWLVKTDASGNQSWEKNFGTTGNDSFYSLQAVSDGYVMAGIKYVGPAYHADAWLLKTNLSGTMSWEKTFSGPDTGYSDFFTSVRSVSGGYVMAGTKIVSGIPQGWLVKTDTSGNLTWDQGYGGGVWMMMECVTQTPDGGYILGGTSGTGVSLSTLIKTDASGSQDWQRTFSHSAENDFMSVINTTDLGYAAAGNAYDQDTGACDAFVVKVKQNP